jgi:DNA-binding response OmpR family regulator
MAKTILIVEDDLFLASRLRSLLHDNLHCRVLLATNLKEARAFLQAQLLPLVVLDRRLPDGDGLILVKEARTAFERTAFLIMTSRGLLAEREEGILAGAVDYLVKPFSKIELVVKVRRLLEKQWLDDGEERFLQSGLSFLPDRRYLRLDGKLIKLTPRENQALCLLLGNRGNPVAFEIIRQEVLASGQDVSANALAATVSRLRRKLGRFGRYLKVDRLLGYQLKLTKPHKANTKIACGSRPQKAFLVEW